MRVIHRDDRTAILELSVHAEPYETIRTLFVEISDGYVTLHQMYSSTEPVSMIISRRDAEALAKYLLQGEQE